MKSIFFNWFGNGDEQAKQLTKLGVKFTIRDGTSNSFNCKTFIIENPRSLVKFNSIVKIFNN